MNPAEEIKQLFPDSFVSVGHQTNKPLAIIKKEGLLKIAEKVKEMGFDNLSECITGIDYGDRFEVVYNFPSYTKNRILY